MRPARRSRTEVARLCEPQRVGRQECVGCFEDSLAGEAAAGHRPALREIVATLSREFGRDLMVSAARSQWTLSRILTSLPTQFAVNRIVAALPRQLAGGRRLSQHCNDNWLAAADCLRNAETIDLKGAYE
jgi:hypothetical protein